MHAELITKMIMNTNLNFLSYVVDFLEFVRSASIVLAHPTHSTVHALENNIKIIVMTNNWPKINVHFFERHAKVCLSCFTA